MPKPAPAPAPEPVSPEPVPSAEPALTLYMPMAVKRPGSLKVEGLPHSRPLQFRDGVFGMIEVFDSLEALRRYYPAPLPFQAMAPTGKEVVSL